MLPGLIDPLLARREVSSQLARAREVLAAVAASGLLRTLAGASMSSVVVREKATPTQVTYLS